MVHEVTGKKWSNFAVTKSDMVEHTCEHLNKLTSCNILVWYIGLDSTGENPKLAKCTGSSD